MSLLYISPINSIYSYNNRFNEVLNHTNIFKSILRNYLDDNNISNLESNNFPPEFKAYLTKFLKILPYVEKNFLSKLDEKKIRPNLIAFDQEEIFIIRYELEALNILHFFNDIVIKDNIKEGIIIIDKLSLWEKKNTDNILIFLNTLIFEDTDEYLSLQKENISLINRMPDFIFESIRQSINIILYIYENLKETDYRKLIEIYLSNSLYVVYFFDDNNYRKREVAVTTNEIYYIPFITRNYGDFSIYKKIDLFLQRAPYYYLKNKEKCFKIDHDLKKLGIPIMHEFNIIDKVFYRFNVYNYISDFCDKAKDNLKEKYNINLKIPNSILFDRTSLFISSEIKKKLIDITLNIINYPYIIKPNPCSEHEMFLIISEEGIDNFLEVNLDKILKYDLYIIQEFISHEGIMFKNYSLNNKFLTITRPSLPNLEGKNMEIKHFENKCMNFQNEMLYSKSDKNFFDQIEINEKIVEEINYEALDYISNLFYQIQGLSLFGLDYLYDKQNDTYYLLEVNYFPSFREFKENLSIEFNQHILSYHKLINNNN